MNVKRYVAPTAPEVLLAARKDLGPDAVVIACWAGAGGVEVLAEAARTMRASAPLPELCASPDSVAPVGACRRLPLTARREAFRRLSAEEASLMLAGSGRGD